MTRFIDNPKLKTLSEAVFYLALILELFYVFWDKSDLTPFWDGAYFRVVFGLVLFRVLTVKRSLKEWGCLAVLAVLGIISWKLCGRNDMLRILAWIAACKGMEMSKVMKAFFRMSCLGCTVLVALSLLGIFGRVSLGTVYRGGDHGGYEIRYCLGMGHPNALHCMAFMLTVLFLYVYFQRLKLYWLLILFALQLGLFLLTDSRMGFFGAVFALAAAAVFLLFGEKPGARRFLMAGGIGVCLGVILFSIACAARTSISDAFWWNLNYYTNGRIQAAYQTANLSSWGLFGSPENLSELDMGIVRLFFWYGWVPALCACLLGLYGLYFSLKEKDYASALLILSLSVYSLFEAHLISPILGRDPLIFLMGMLIYERGMLKRDLRKC